MSRLFVGGDPGKSGAVAIIDEDGKLLLIDKWDMNLGRDLCEAVFEGAIPCSKDSSVGRGGVGTVSWLDRVRDSESLFICGVVEHVHSMPKQGVKSTFSFGDAFGQMKMCFHLLCDEMTLISPQKWQSTMHTDVDGDTTKARSLSKARDLYPDVGRIDHNKADAVLIAHYCRMLYR